MGNTIAPDQLHGDCDSVLFLLICLFFYATALFTTCVRNLQAATQNEDRENT